jgi:anti-sigma regulatory factor (Ser/Thr protein kinase)
VTLFPPETASVRDARRVAVEQGGVDGQVADDLALLVSELAANAVLHAQTAFTLGVSRVGDVLRVEVGDTGPSMPRLEHRSIDAPTGRGLRLVDALAARWGITPGREGQGKTVWFELDLGSVGARVTG